MSMTGYRKYDLIRQQFGDWQILKEGKPYQNKCNSHTRRTWTCKCTHKLRDGTECGEIVDVYESNLVRGTSVMCSKCAATCKKPSNKIEAGMIFGKWKVLEEITTARESRTYEKGKYKCECQCPLKTIRTLNGGYLLRGNDQRCGKLGCEPNGRNGNAIIGENGEILSHVCSICREMKPISKFRRTLKYKVWECLDCSPYAEKKTREQVELHERYAFYRDRAKKKKKNLNENFEFELTEKEFDEITKQKCFYCGGYSLSTRYHGNYCGIDRVDNHKGYTKENIVPCCNICNQMKMQRNPYEWLQQMKKIWDRKDEIVEGLKEKGITENTIQEGEIFNNFQK